MHLAKLRIRDSSTLLSLSQLAFLLSYPMPLNQGFLKWSTDPLGVRSRCIRVRRSTHAQYPSTLRSKTKLIARAVCTREFSPPPPPHHRPRHPLAHSSPHAHRTRHLHCFN
ncbi:hypothetical protein EVAR_65152_1 [Eumeta japonica]|uniref:Uncharacterized protein n=1 Tax=Eumeta variegata TaxID=151549 RepID=A0A4C2ABN9_EUMVA|nr:hypothetical protein EVAR_65152_1 [Eumeta japonica]